MTDHRPVFVDGARRTEIECCCGAAGTRGDDEFVAHVRAAQEAPAPEGLLDLEARIRGLLISDKFGGESQVRVDAHNRAIEQALAQFFPLIDAMHGAEARSPEGLDAFRDALARLDHVARVSDLTPVGEAELQAALDQSYWLLHPDQRPSAIDVAARADAERRAGSAGGATKP